MPRRNGTAIVAVGGNALITDEGHMTVPDQFRAAAATSRHIADMIAQGWNVVITHGNGPQVGFILRRSEIAGGEVPPEPMDYAGADTQGAIGYMFQRAMHNEMIARGMDRKAVTVITEVLVDRDDPAFGNPTKPVGAFMDAALAKQRAAEKGWDVREEPGRGWRRVVPSPLPHAVVDIDAIVTLADAGFIVIACGGGGIPVIEDADGNYQGVEAVVDKDYASGLLACGMGADMLVIPTVVEKVALEFGKPAQRWLDRMTVSEARKHHADGQFPAGSMGPKIEAIADFLDAGGQKGLITNPPNIGRALAGETGTWIVPD